MAESKEHRDFLERSRAEFAHLMDDLECILKAKSSTLTPQIKAVDELIEKWITAEEGWMSDHTVVTDEMTKELKDQGAEFRRRILVA